MVEQNVTPWASLLELGFKLESSVYCLSVCLPIHLPQTILFVVFLQRPWLPDQHCHVMGIISCVVFSDWLFYLPIHISSYRHHLLHPEGTLNKSALLVVSAIWSVSPHGRYARPVNSTTLNLYGAGCHLVPITVGFPCSNWREGRVCTSTAELSSHCHFWRG